jgi:hypothetical protein
MRYQLCELLLERDSCVRRPILLFQVHSWRTRNPSVCLSDCLVVFRRYVFGHARVGDGLRARQSMVLNDARLKADLAKGND